jgi:hypothetical protein
MHLPINVKSPNNISKWHMGFNSAFKGLMSLPVPLDAGDFLTEDLLPYKKKRLPWS